MRTDYTLTGQIDQQGNFLISNRSIFQDFLSRHKGKSVLCTVQVLEPKATPTLRAYFFNKVLPDFQQAFLQNGERLTLEQVTERIKELSPIMRIESYDENGKYNYELKEIMNLSNQELIYFIDHLREIAAEELSFYIGDPNEY